MINRETLSVDGSDMLVLGAIPDGDGPHPVYIECFHARGHDAFTESVVERLADNGYAAFSHNLFHRIAPDVERPSPLLADTEMVRDTEALIAHIGSLGACDMARLAIGGHCMGGRVALLAAANPSGFRAVANFWGGNVVSARAPKLHAVIDIVKNIECPVVGFFGNEDTNPSPADADRLDQELTAHNIPHVFHRFDGAGHAFQNFLQENRYLEDLAEDAWAKAIDFLNQHVALGPRPAQAA